MKKIAILFSVLISASLLIAGCANNRAADQSPAVSSDNSAAQTGSVSSKKKYNDYKGEKIQ